MKKAMLIFIGLVFVIQGIAQTNLVLNPGFENSNYTSLGTRQQKGQGYLVYNWYNPLPKRSPSVYILPDRSVAMANSGTSAIGLVLGSSKQEKTKTEFITGELAQPLVAGQTYCVSFNIILHRSSKWAAQDIGLLFHADQDLLSNTSDIKSLKANLYANDGGLVTNTKWIEFNGYYVASGGETFITFGSFGDGECVEMTELGFEPYFQVDGLNNKAYYQLDDISVIAQSDNFDCGCATPPVREEVSVESTNGLQPYLFALDASGSMKRGGVFDSLRNNLVELLKQLPLGTPVTFSTFSEESSSLYSGKIESSTPEYVDSLLSKIEVGGGTSVFSGLQNAYLSYKSTWRDSAKVILISDGSFSVTNKIEELVKLQYENHGRRLTVIQIANKPKGAERLEPYETSFVQVALSELNSAIFQVYKPSNYSAVACECNNIYSDTMNYHFVIDYSGSMKTNKLRAIHALKNLYEQAPATAVISITAFSVDAELLYEGKKSEMSMKELTYLLGSHVAEGGTDPAPGVNHALGIAKRMAGDRFSHLIIITDLSADNMNQNAKMKTYIQNMSQEIELAVSSATVDLSTSMDVLMSGRAQFDITTGVFRDVSKTKFEKDLFQTTRSSCDYTTQPYHYNPATDFAKDVAKMTFKLILREILAGAL